MTADGKPYYQNVITRITSWDPPVGWKETSPSVETTSVAHALFENKGDVHEETAKALSSERGDKTDGSPGEPLVGTCRWNSSGMFVLCKI